MRPLAEEIVDFYWLMQLSENAWYLCNRNGLLLHGLMDGDPVIFSHLSKKKKAIV